MAIAVLYNIPSTADEWLAWSFANMDHHRQIVDGALAQKRTTLELFPLDPITLDDLAEWAIVHQQAHDSFTSLLGISGSDLTTVNLHDPDQLNAWVWLHASEHRQANSILGIDQ